MVGTSPTMTTARVGVHTDDRPMPHRDHIVRLARAWIGTPYHHQASARGIGTDCVGLVRGVYRELTGADAEAPPAYSRDCAEGQGRETLLEAARRHLVEIPKADARPGDVLVFRYRAGALAKHAAIMVHPTSMIHAMEGAPVCEVALSPWWRRHLAAAFQFPEVVIPECAPAHIRDPAAN
jgi:NlpC/P60 family putative phage cell wall peptidase